ncbi:MAG: hypothetical protein ACI8Z7_000335 [Candidatus Nanohaloarchaea archaeon]|jgi:hypothetical protein
MRVRIKRTTLVNGKKNRQQEVLMRITKIQDDGERFIIHGDGRLLDRLKEVFDQMALGVSVTESEDGVANILYTENNRDIVLQVLNDHTETNSK